MAHSEALLWQNTDKTVYLIACNNCVLFYATDSHYARYTAHEQEDSDIKQKSRVKKMTVHVYNP